MYLAYVDASGRPYKCKNDPDSESLYVLSCLIANEQHWQYIDNRVKQIKQKHFPNLAPEDIEIHAKDMLNREGLFKTLTFEKIYDVFTDVFGFLAEDKTDICIISVIINKDKLYKGKDADEWAYRLLVERLNMFLSKKNKERLSNGLNAEFGIMIIDSCGVDADTRLRKNITNMMKKGTYYSDLRYLIEDPLFTDSKWRNLSQLTDCVAYATKKRYRNTPNPTFHDENWISYFDMIYQKFDADEEGNPSGCGIKIFP